MKILYLTSKKNKKAFTLVDDEDFEFLKRWKWQLSTTGYARRVSSAGKYSFEMHRVIIKAPSDKVVDHINGNSLDNRKKNLRLCERFQNQANHKLYKNNSSGVSGVSWSTEKRKWAAQISVKGKIIFLGRFNDFNKAVLIRKEAAQKHFGEFAPSN